MGKSLADAFTEDYNNSQTPQQNLASNTPLQKRGLADAFAEDYNNPQQNASTIPMSSQTKLLPSVQSNQAQTPASLWEQLKAGFGTGVIGPEGAAIQAARGALHGTNALNRASQGIDYAFQPEHSILSNSNINYSNPGASGIAANVAGQLGGSLVHSLVDPIGGLLEGGGVLENAASNILNLKKIKSATSTIPINIAGAAGGLGASTIASNIANKYLPQDIDPQTKSDLMNIIGASSGLAGGALGAGGITKIMPENEQIAVARQQNAVLNTPEAQELIQNNPQTATPSAQQSNQTLSSQENNTNNSPTSLTNIMGTIKDTLNNAKQMYSQRYNQVKNIIGDNKIQLDPDAITANEALGKISGGKLDSGLDDVITEVPTFKQSINWLRDNFFGQILNTKEGEEAPELSFDNLQKSFGILNNLTNSLNIKNLPTDIKSQLIGYRDILKNGINDHLQTGEENGMYPEGTSNIYKDADFLYGKTQNAIQTNKSLDPTLTNSKSSENDLKLGLRNSLLTGQPQAQLENITQAMQDKAGQFPEDNTLIDKNINNVNTLHQTANNLAANQGGKSILQLNQGLMDQRDILNDPTASNNVQSSPIIDNTAFNNTINNHIANLFGQGLSKDTYTPELMTKAINDMADMHDTMLNSGTSQGLNPDTIKTLEQAKSIQNILKMGNSNPAYNDYLKSQVAQFKDNSPNAATQAATILSDLEAVKNRIALQRANLGEPKNQVVKTLLNNTIHGKIINMFKTLAGYKDTNGAQAAALNHIQNNITTAPGRAQLNNIAKNSQNIVNQRLAQQQQNMIGGALRGAAVGVNSQ